MVDMAAAVAEEEKKIDLAMKQTSITKKIAAAVGFELRPRKKSAGKRHTGKAGAAKKRAVLGAGPETPVVHGSRLFCVSEPIP